MWPSSGLKGATVVALAFVASTSSVAVRADNYYLRLTGGTPGIIGESTVKGYEHWIDIDSVSWSADADTTWTKGGGASVGKPNPGELRWTQSFDSSVPAMYSYITAGLAVPNAVVEYTRTNGGGETTYLQLNMGGLFFTEIAFDGNTVSAAGVFKTISVTYWPEDTKGGRDKPIGFSWDIPAGVVETEGTLAAVVAGYGPGNVVGRGAALAALSTQDVALVPEPETWAMVAAGLLLVGLAVRRQVPKSGKVAA